MSSYSCVLPIDWDRLRGDVLPSWLSLLSGAISAAEFYSKHVQLGDEFVRDMCLDDSYRVPSDYLALFSDVPRLGWETASIIASPAGKEFAQCMDLTCADRLLAVAIKQSSAVQLPGVDRFEKEPYGGYYSRLMDKPHVQVAGTKNLYHFLNGIFAFDWHPSSHLYRVSRKSGPTNAMFALLESLFLGVRALPGVGLASEIPSWPATDDLTFAGYLAPDEVRNLADVIAELGLVADEHDDDLFPLLVDRVQRAAESGLGLLTIHGGL